MNRLDALDALKVTHDPNNDETSTALYSWDSTGEITMIDSENAGDPYDMIGRYLMAVAVGNFPTKDLPDGIVLASRGFATPMTPDGEPDRDAERRRCMVLVAVNVEGATSDLTLFDTDDDGKLHPVQEERSTDDNSGGKLAEALDGLAVILWGYEYAARLFARSLELGDEKNPGAKHFHDRAENAVRVAAVVTKFAEEGDDNEPTVS